VSLIERRTRVVITGAAGFIGSAVARAVQARGGQVVAVVQPGADKHRLRGIAAERVVADIRDTAAVRAACQGAQFVFHLAAIYHFWARDPRVLYDVNVAGRSTCSTPWPPPGASGWWSLLPRASWR
jgi:dihydroflavonol-4-reductase